jgi:hypothetical protein
MKHAATDSGKPINYEEIKSRFNYGPYTKFPFQMEKDGIMLIYADSDFRVPDVSDWYQLYKLTFYMESFCKKKQIIAFTNQNEDAIHERLDRANFMAIFDTYYNQGEIVDYLLAHCKNKNGIPPGNSALIIIINGEVKIAYKTTLEWGTFKFWVEHVLRNYCDQPEFIFN